MDEQSGIQGSTSVRAGRDQGGVRSAELQSDGRQANVSRFGDGFVSARHTQAHPQRSLAGFDSEVRRGSANDWGRNRVTAAKRSPWKLVLCKTTAEDGSRCGSGDPGITR
jgi:hypothetical protein